MVRAAAGLAIPLSSIAATQSSTDDGGIASRALTASPQTSWPGTCTHTLTQDAWWKATLTDSWTVSSITLTNRAGCCPERLQNLDIYVGDTKCASSVSVDGGATKTIPCVGTGTTIKVQHTTGTSHHSLTLCGFSAHGTPGALAYYRPYSQLQPALSPQQFMF